MLSGVDEGDPGSFHRPIVAGRLLWFMKGKTMGSPIRLQRLAIGIYVDSDGVADFRIDEILATLGYPLERLRIGTKLSNLSRACISAG